MPRILESDAIALARGIDQMPPEQQAQAASVLQQYKEQQDAEGLPHWPQLMADQEAETKRFRSMFADLSNVDSAAPAIAPVVKYAADPDEHRARVASTAFLATRYGKPADEIANGFELYAADYAAKTWNESTPLDSKRFYARAKTEIQGEVDREDLTNSLGESVTRSALLGDKTGWQAWKEKAQTMPGWKPELEGQLFSVWRDSESKLKADMGDNAALIRRTVQSLQSKTGVEDNAAEWSRPEYDLRELAATDLPAYKKTLRMIQRVATVAAKDNKDGVLGWFQKAGESLARGVEGIGEGFVENAQRMASGIADTAGATDTAKLNDASQRVAHDLRAIANGIVDPVKRTNWFDTMAFGSLESAPLMVTGMMNPLNTVLLTSGQYAGDAQAYFDDHGWTGAGSKVAAQTVGVAAAAVENWSEMFGSTAWGKAAMQAVGAGPNSKLITRFLGGLAPRAANEWGEEIVQDNLAAATQSMLNAVGLSVGAPAPFMEEVSGWVKTQGADTALVVMPLALLGAGLTTSQEIGEAKAHALLGDVAQTAKVIGREAADRIAAIQDPAARAAEFQKAYQAQTAEKRQEWLSASHELQKAKEEFAAATNTEAEAQALSITHDETGWRLNMADGGTVRVDGPQAAVALRKDLMQASTEDEARALVSVVEDWQKNAPADTKRETSFTGEQVKLGSDGQLIGERAGGDVRVIDSPQLLRDIRSQAQSTGLGAEVDLVVNGSNSVFAQSVNEASRQIIQRLQINRSNEQAPIITVLHEQLEANLKAANLGGTVDAQETMNALSRVAEALPVAAAQQRLASLERRGAPQAHIDEARREVDLRQRLQAVASGEGDEAAMREIAVELAVADVIARDKAGMQTGFSAGTISTALDSAIESATSPREVRALGKFRAFLRSVRAWVRSVLGTVAGFQKARRDGKLTDGDAWNAWLDKVTGVTEQARYDQELADELKAIAGQDETQYGGPGEGMAFILSRVTPAQDAEYMQAVESGDMEAAQRMVDDMAKAAGGVRVFSGVKGGKIEGGEFDPAKLGGASGSDLSKQGYFFTKDRSVAANYARVANGKVLEFFLFPKNTHETSQFHGVDASKIFADGHDSILFKQVEDVWGPSDNYMMGIGTESLIKSADAITRDEAGNVIPLSQRFNPADNRITFSLSPSRNLELVQSSIDSQLSRDPDKRLALAAKAKSKLEALRDRWESEGWTTLGHYKRPIVEKRSKASLDSEQAVRQALRESELVNEGLSSLSPQQAETYYGDVQKLEDHPLVSAMLNDQGRLMSKTTAIAQGKLKTDGKGNAGDYDSVPWLPPSWYSSGGGIMPDVMAQALYDDGKLKEPTADALWSALSSVIESQRKAKASFDEAAAAVREISKQANEQARSEAQTWRDEQDAMQSKDWNPRAALVRDLQLLDSVLSVMPPEVRGRVGGFVKLAQLATEDARVKELEKRVSKLDVILDRFLSDEYRERIDKLLEKASPKMQAGKKPKGSMEANAHRLVSLIRDAMKVPESSIDGKRADIEKAMMEDGADLADLAERLQILELFGGVDEMEASELAAAHDFLADVVKTGKNRWKMVEEMRLAEQRKRAEALKTDTGKNGSPAELQKLIEQEKTLKQVGVGWSMGLKSFKQVIGALFGEKSEQGQRIVSGARRATNARTDAVRAKRGAFETAMRSIFKAKTWGDMQEKLWSLSQTTTPEAISVDRSERKVSKVTVPREIIERLMDNPEQAKALGFEPIEVQMLVNQWLDEKNDGKTNFTLERVSFGKAETVTLSQMQAVNLTMLARQSDYQDALTYHGYTPELIGKLEDGLADEAKLIRGWLAQQYRDGYQSINEVFQRMFGAPLPKIANYSPGTWEGMAGGATILPEGGMMGGGGLNPGALKTRRKHTAAPRLDDALAVYWSHVATTEHFKAFGEVVRDMRATMLDPKTRAAVKAKGGSAGLNAMTDWIKVFEMDGIKQAISLNEMQKFTSRLQNVYSVSALAWNVGTMAKQSLAVLNAAYQMPAGEFIRGFSRLMRGKIDFAAMLKSDAIRRRVEAGASPELRQVMSGFMAAHPGNLTRKPRELVNLGMELLGEADGFFTGASAAIYHDYVRREALASGLNDDEANALAMRKTEEMIGDTSQPVELMDRSLFEVGNTAIPTARWVFMFASEARQKFALYVPALARVLKGQGTAQDKTVTLVSHIVAPLILQTLTNILQDWRDDDDDEILDMTHWSPARYLKAMALGPVSGLPLLGGVGNAALSWLFGTRDFFNGTNDPLSELVGRGASAIRSMTGDKAKHEQEPIEKGMNATKTALNIVAAASALSPVGQPLGWLGTAGNTADQVFDWIDNLLGRDKKKAEK